MAAVRSKSPRRRAASSQIVRAAAGPDTRATDTTHRLDATDWVLIGELSANARLTNNALAEAAGIAPSTCLGRVRALVDAGVLRGFHADVDPALAGRPLQAMVAVRMQAHARSRLGAFLQELAELPGVLNVFLLGGAHDFFVHVAATDSGALNEFVVGNLSGNPDVALTETSLIFQHVRSARYA